MYWLSLVAKIKYYGYYYLLIHFKQFYIIKQFSKSWLYDFTPDTTLYHVDIFMFYLTNFPSLVFCILYNIWAFFN